MPLRYSEGRPRKPVAPCKPLLRRPLVMWHFALMSRYAYVYVYIYICIYIYIIIYMYIYIYVCGMGLYAPCHLAHNSAHGAHPPCAMYYDQSPCSSRSHPWPSAPVRLTAYVLKQREPCLRACSTEGSCSNGASSIIPAFLHSTGQPRYLVLDTRLHVEETTSVAGGLRCFE